jgi:GH35 family endo-1,4-beta-xylanase
MAGIKMAVEAYRQDKVVFWDPVNECYAASHPRPNRSSKIPAENA